MTMPFLSMLAEPMASCGSGFHLRCGSSFNKAALSTNRLRHELLQIVRLMGDRSQLSLKRARSGTLEISIRLQVIADRLTKATPESRISLCNALAQLDEK